MFPIGGGRYKPTVIDRFFQRETQKVDPSSPEAMALNAISADWQNFKTRNSGSPADFKKFLQQEIQNTDPKNPKATELRQLTSDFQARVGQSKQNGNQPPKTTGSRLDLMS
jgi:hypothetical protein